MKGFGCSRLPIIKKDSYEFTEIFELTIGERFGLVEVLVPEPVPSLEVVEVLANETGEGRPQNAVTQGAFCQRCRVQVDIVHVPEEVRII